MRKESQLNPVISRVKERLASAGLSAAEAAAQIGVTPASFERHLRGEYVRSDSLAKYRRWLDGERVTPAESAQLLLVQKADGRELRRAEREALANSSVAGSWVAPVRPHYVIDLFSGCGGMSLGFDVYGEGKAFQTVLGLDIEEPMVRAFNSNFPAAEGAPPLGRRVDLSDFRTEAEVLAFYLDHLAAVTREQSLERELQRLPSGPLELFKQRIGSLDRDFLRGLTDLRLTKGYLSAYSEVDAVALGQTSVIAFHAALSLPIAGARTPELPPIIWADCVTLPATLSENEGLTVSRRSRNELERLWESEVRQLEEKAEASGEGQLASSAKKIKSFLGFVHSEPMREVRDLWLTWMARRDELRAKMFDTEEAGAFLRSIYTRDRWASVILGGPPCQGFSRIGRGKIRSLREHGVHAHVDAEAGDERNLLLLKYTLFVAALRPDVFLFENVRHFQAEVKTPEGTFSAPEVLAEAIKEMSEDGADYVVAMATVDCSAHLVPQTRERFVMAGVRSDVASAIPTPRVAEWTITLPVREVVPLLVALDGLPEPHVVAGASGGALARTVDVHLDPRPHSDAASQYLAWIRQRAPSEFSRGDGGPSKVDSHVVRAGRADDRALFSLMGPGKRWMDYRCDDSATLKDLRATVEAAAEAARGLKKARQKLPDGVERLVQMPPEVLQRAVAALDGSLSIRLLLEGIPPMPGELEHHLLAPGYLSKREGRHGDWLARMDAARPSKTIVSHMAKDAYMYVHPFAPRALSVREAARVQTFPDWFAFGGLGLVDAFRVVGNAVPPLLSFQFAERVAQVLQAARAKARKASSIG